MKEDYRQVIEESIRIELQVAELYLLFFHYLPQDKGFWWKIALEEKNHAALIRSLLDLSEELQEFPEDMFSSSLVELVETNSMLSTLIEKFTAEPPDRETAFNTALKIEESAGELHYQGFMENGKDSNMKIAEIFRQLNREDKDHSIRIRAYMLKNNINLL